MKMKRIVWVLITISILILSVTIYLQTLDQSEDMTTTAAIPVKNETFKQKVLRTMYPFIRKMGKKGKNGSILVNTHEKVPAAPFYDLVVVLNGGQPFNFSELKNRKVLLVNTASDCGYTGQYAELQSLHERFGDSLQIIAFPANDFADQEKSSDQEIAQFCQINYGVNFPIAIKGVVVKNNQQQAVFKWLTDSSLNGWNDHAPDWNFGKYIINESGVLTHYFGPAVSPLEPQFLAALGF